MDHHLQAFMLAFWASMGTFVGAVIVLIFIRLFGATDTTFAMGIMNAFSAGVMLFITAFHLIPESIESIGEMETMSYFFVGILLFGIIERLLHDHSDTKEAKGKEHSAKGKERESKDLIRASQITFIAMALHNLPEGLSVYLSSLSNPKMGLQLALAIMLHNIPEGMAVAVPIYAATKSSVKVLWYTFLNGFAEPIGVVIGGILLHPYLTPAILSKCLALVGGIMLCISIHELQPGAIKYSGKDFASIFFVLGMLVCWGSLEAVNVFFGHSHHHDHSGHGHHHSHHGHSDHGHHHSHHGHSDHGHHHSHHGHNHDTAHVEL